MFQETPTYGIAFMAGFLTFFSPCILPLVPSYLLYLTGMTLKEFNSQERLRLFNNALFFVLGFSFIFVLLGALAGLLGSAVSQYRDILRVFGGALIIFFALMMLEIVKFDFLMSTKRFNFKSKPVSLAGSFLVGMTFGAAWTPCVGPVLGSILVLAGASQTIQEGVILLIVYSIGLAMPFLAASQLLGWLIKVVKPIEKYFDWITKISAALLLVVGILVMTNYLDVVTGWFMK